MVQRLALGARQVLGPGLARLGIQVFDCYFGERRIENVPPPVEPRIPLRMRPVLPEDAERLLQDLDDAAARDVRLAIADGSEGVLAETDGRIAGFIWARLDYVDINGQFVCRLPCGGAYIHTAYVVADLRGKKVLQAAARELHELLRERGCTFTCRLIDRANIASLEGTARGGIRYRWAPILKLPGMRPFFVLGRPAALAGGARDRRVR